MSAFRILLVVMFAALFAYTAIVVMNHGWSLFDVFFGDLFEMGWPGQFNADFMGFLILSALWTAWRNSFTPSGLGLAVLAAFGGFMFLAPYLLYLSVRTQGDMAQILLGARRA